MTHPDPSPACMEASSAELLAVAKHLWREGMSHRAAVGHAYQLIREARLLSGHLQYLNRPLHDPTQTTLRDLVWQSARNAHGQPLRVPLLVSLMKSLGRGANPDNASKRFNEWIAESLRKESFRAVMPYDATAPGVDKLLHQQLREHGWIRFHEDDRGGHHLIIPPNTAPATLSRRKPMAGHHETSPYWNTPDVWWPAAGSDEIKLRKSRYLTAGGDAFLGMHIAESTMEAFRDWLVLEEKMKKSTGRKQQPRNAGGVLVSAKDNGAGRDAEGRYGGRKRK